MRRHLSLFIFSAIILLTFLLRFYYLNLTPPAVDWDEASSAYNGYSILKTGKDEFGQTFPILFRSYDAYVPPLLIYLNAGSEAIFGLNEFAARLPNALLGVFSIAGIYFLSYSIIGSKKPALLSAFILAVSPWHVSYSRVDTFASLPVVFIIFGTLFFLKGLDKKQYFIFSVLCFILAIFSYYSAYVFAPLFLVGLILIFRKKIHFLNMIMLLLPVFLLSFFLLFIAPGGQSRFKGVSSIGDPDVIKESVAESQNEGAFGKIIHNRRLIFAEKFLEGYFSPVQFSFLFSKGDAVSRMVVPGPGFGLLYWLDLVFLLIGIYALRHIKRPNCRLLLLWLLLIPVPASLTLPQPVSTRLTLIIPVLAIFISYGLWYLNKKKFRLSIFMSLFLFIEILLFVHQYFLHFPREKSNEWFYAYKPLFTFLNQKENSSKKVFFVFKQPDFLDQAHMFTAFYNRLDPAFYQKAGGTRLGRIGTTGEFSVGRFFFIPDQCSLCGRNADPQDLVITSHREPFPGYKIINFFDGAPALYIYSAETTTIPYILSSFTK